MSITLLTIGFTKKSAEEFFTRLQEAGVRRVVDTRLNNTSQLAGFAKARDLEYFLRACCNIQYAAHPELAPTKEILDAYKKQKGSWEEYERKFLALIEQRRIAQTLSPADLDEACLLCSEETPEHCHRRLVAEYLDDQWSGVKIVHL